MRALLLAGTIVACACTPRSPVAIPAVPEPAHLEDRIAVDELLADIAWLADPQRAGRAAYSPGATATADWIERAFASSGLETMRQPIPGGATNVIGILRGDDERSEASGRGPRRLAEPRGIDRAIVVGAHYDHLGTSDGAMYPGADDNASGTAVVVALARAAGRTHARGKHTVIFVGFGAEEIGVLGSAAYVADPPVPLARTALMINFDMVGRDFLESVFGGRSGTFAIVGMESAPDAEGSVRRAAAAEQATIVPATAQFVADTGYRADDSKFRERGVPSIWFSTSMHDDYHRPTDTIDKIKPRQLLLVARTAARVIEDLADLRVRDR